MTRRNFLKYSLGAGSVLPLATPAVAQSTTGFRMMSTDEGSAQIFADYMNRATDGAMTVETTVVAPAEAPTMLASVANGDADMCLTGLDSFITENLAFGLFAAMPFGMTTGELEGWVHASDGADILAMLAADYGVSMHFAGDGGPKGLWSKNPLPNNAAGLQALTVGSTGLGMMNMQQAGVANVVDINAPGADLASLDVIDGMAVTDMVAAGLTGAFTHLAMTNPNTPNAVQALATANAVMDGLTEGQQVLLSRACSAALNEGRARRFHDNATALTAIKADLSIQPLPDDLWDGLQGSAQALLETIFNEGDNQAAAVDAYVYFQTDIAAWSEIGEAAFYTGRKKSLAL